MNKELHKAQDDVLNWCQKTFGEDFYQVVTHHHNSDSITMDISQPVYTNKYISVQFNVDNGDYTYDCRIESEYGCELEFNHEKIWFTETLNQAMKWIGENKKDSILKQLSEILPVGSLSKKTEYEIIARNILFILYKTKGQFRELTWDEYMKQREIDGDFSLREKQFFDQVIEYTTSAEKCAIFSPKWRFK